jgi:hypothetical protein
LVPCFDGFSFGVTEAVFELVGSALYLSEYPFDAVAIPVRFVAESQPVMVTGGFEPRRTINEEECVVDEMFLPKIRDEHLRKRSRSRRKQPDGRQAVRCRVDDGVQSVLSVGELDHGLVDGDVIRVRTAGGLLVGFLYPVVNG